MGTAQQATSEKAKKRSAGIPSAVEDKTAVRAQTRASRLWEIDALRGTAVITMIIYHFGWDLVSFGLAAFNPYEGLWFLIQRYTCITFILLSGLSLTLVDWRLERQGVDTRGRFIHFVKRGAWIFMWGMVLTIVMGALRWAGVLAGGVDFGVLHLIGFSTIAAFPVLRRPWLAFAGWAILVVLGGFTPGWNVESPWFVWLGFFPADYYAVDYFPVIPWFGVALLGVAIGNWVYPQGRRNFALADHGDEGIVRGLRYLGRHSLTIYLLHQPILFGILYLYSLWRFS